MTRQEKLRSEIEKRISNLCSERTTSEIMLYLKILGNSSGEYRERYRQMIENKLILSCSSRHLKNRILVQIEEYVYLATGDRMGLTEADIVDACKVADECGLS